MPTKTQKRVMQYVINVKTTEIDPPKNEKPLNNREVQQTVRDAISQVLPFGASVTVRVTKIES